VCDWIGRSRHVVPLQIVLLTKDDDDITDFVLYYCTKISLWYIFCLIFHVYVYADVVH